MRPIRGKRGETTTYVPARLHVKDSRVSNVPFENIDIKGLMMVLREMLMRPVWNFLERRIEGRTGPVGVDDIDEIMRCQQYINDLVLPFKRGDTSCMDSAIDEIMELKSTMSLEREARKAKAKAKAPVRADADGFRMVARSAVAPPPPIHVSSDVYVVGGAYAALATE